jgi:hypothetical protein
MRIFLGDAGEVRMDGIDEFAAMIIRELPGIASSTDERSDARIYQSPTGGKDEEVDSDWKDMVEPEMRELFAEAMDLVIDDLAKLETTEADGLCLTIPTNHVDAWIHTLNRARLILGEQWDVTEEDMTYGSGESDSDPERPMAILKIEFYGMILGYLVDMKWEE